VEAPQGSRTQMTLPDGTKVWLNAGSKISYTQGFSLVNRLVMLVGEGYFEVAHNEQLPFRVSSKNLQVSVLGTKFNFRDYPADAEAAVSLAEGKVALDDLVHLGKETIYLKPNQRAVMNKQSGEISVEDYAVSNTIQWTNGNLIFDGEPLKDIIKDLERSYNVKITIADKKLLTVRFYGDFVRQEQSLNEVLDALSATGKIHYKSEGKNITLY
jgi:ferric-dicitrate binding protein FerR (iron transport regulator)